MQQRKESRRCQRFPVETPVAVCWQDVQGRFRTQQARGIDVCETGLQVEVVEAVDLHTTVTVRSEKLRLSASTTVRYCSRRGPRFRLGLEFIGGSRWRPIPEPELAALAVAHR